MVFETFKKNGYVISDKIINSEDVPIIRKDLDLEFDKIKNNGLLLHEFTNENLIKKFLGLYKHVIMKNIKTEFETLLNKSVCIFPTFLVQKNYHVDLNQYHGWHRDCGGELKYKYCNQILGNDNYFFSKIGFYLQENTEFGGSIDIIKNSHKNFSKYKIFFRKVKNIPLRMISFFHNYFRKIYNLIPETFFMKLLNAKRLYPNVGTAVIFDSRIIHRGSPISKNKINEVKFKKGDYQALTPKEFTKYSIYCHFGTVDGLDSYFYDRLKRKKSMSIDEAELWHNQIKFIEKFDKELSNEMSSLFYPVIKKYKHFN